MQVTHATIIKQGVFLKLLVGKAFQKAPCMTGRAYQGGDVYIYQQQ